MNINLNDILTQIMKFLNSIKSKIFGIPLLEDLDLTEIASAFQDYIGLIIINVEMEYDDLLEISDEANGKMITAVTTDNKEIFMELADFSGNYAGKLILTPTLTGQFLESLDSEQPKLWMSRYKIIFIGGATIEYIDPSNLGKVIYVR